MDKRLDPNVTVECLVRLPDHKECRDYRKTKLSMGPGKCASEIAERCKKNRDIHSARYQRHGSAPRSRPLTVDIAIRFCTVFALAYAESRSDGTRGRGRQR